MCVSNLKNDRKQQRIAPFSFIDASLRTLIHNAKYMNANVSTCACMCVCAINVACIVKSAYKHIDNCYCFDSDCCSGHQTTFSRRSAPPARNLRTYTLTHTYQRHLDAELARHCLQQTLSPSHSYHTHAYIHAWTQYQRSKSQNVSIYMYMYVCVSLIISSYHIVAISVYCYKTSMYNPTNGQLNSSTPSIEL